MTEKISRNNTGKNNPFYNKKHTEETRRKISESAKQRFVDPTKNPRFRYRYTEEDKERHRVSKKKFGKPFTGNGELFDTLGDAARKYNLSKQAIKHRIVSSSYEDWFYV